MNIIVADFLLIARLDYNIHRGREYFLDYIRVLHILYHCFVGLFTFFGYLARKFKPKYELNLKHFINQGYYLPPYR